MARIRKFANTIKKTVWKIAVYIRLSREDENDNESESVINQRKILMEYVQEFFEEEYELVDVYVDDGLTGTDTKRPNFMRMIEDVEKGAVNCVVVKSLARAFRNLGDQTKYLEEFFPRNKVRFVNTGTPFIDTHRNPRSASGLEVPIHGMFNEQFAAATSEEVRKTFETKRRQGEFIGAFAPYGYSKDPENKNKLVIDEEAAEVVRDIFRWFVYGGMSKGSITKKLNEMGIPNPAKYKRDKGLRFNNPQTNNNDGLWSTSTIAHILKNQMYIGNMVQGRQRVISYKVHDRIAVPENEWYIKEETHAPIIDKETFDKAQNLHLRDTRTSPKQKNLYLFSGFLRCADCNKALTRRTAKGNTYYACRTYKEKSRDKCTKHSIREDVLYKAVLTAIQRQIEMIDNLNGIIEEINKSPVIRTQSTRLNHLLKSNEKELNKINNALDSLYVDVKSGEIKPQDYQRMKVKFETQAEQLRQIIENLNMEIETMSNGVKSDDPYFSDFLKYNNITCLDREILVALVEKIFVYEGGEIKIDFIFVDKYKQIVEFIECNHRELTVIESNAI